MDQVPTAMTIQILKFANYKSVNYSLRFLIFIVLDRITPSKDYDPEPSDEYES